MKKIFFIWMMASLVACSKRNELEPLNSFNVKTEKLSYLVGDSVQFMLEGDPENIVFWSGEVGSIYEFRNRTTVDGNSINLNFKSYSQFGTADRSSIKLKISTDFNGSVNSEGILEANWVDISDRAEWSPGPDQFPSGNINLDDFAKLNKDMTIGIHFKTTVVNPAQNRWVFRSFDLTSTSTNTSNESITSSIFTLASGGWKSYSFYNPSSVWSIASAQLITGRSLTDLDDDWCISKSFNPNKTTPDKGVAIKNITNNLNAFSKVYSTPGVYKVVFIGTNGNADEIRSMKREIELTITK